MTPEHQALHVPRRSAETSSFLHERALPWHQQSSPAPRVISIRRLLRADRGGTGADHCDAPGHSRVRRCRSQGKDHRINSTKLYTRT